MKIGGVYIRGISKRFWFVLGGLALLIFISSQVLCTESLPTDRANATPAPTTQELASSARSNPDALEQFISEEVSGAQSLQELPGTRIQGLIDDLKSQESLPSGFSVYRLRVYIPDEDAENGLEVYRNLPGWEFYPAIPLGVDNAGDLAQLKESAADYILEDLEGDGFGEGVYLGFREGNVPSTGEAYEVTGLLYSVFRNVSTETTVTEEPPLTDFAPVFLADGNFRPIKDVEIEAPADYRALINIPVTSGHYKLNLRYLDWPSGGQPRLCLSVGSSGALSRVRPWTDGLETTRLDTGSSDSLLDSGDASGAEPYNSELLDTESFLETGQPPVTDYLVFADTVTGQPQEDVTIIMSAPRTEESTYDGTDPGLPGIKIAITPDQWQDVSTGKVQSEAACSRL